MDAHGGSPQPAVPLEVSGDGGSGVLVGYDGSLAAGAAIEAGALLLPGRHATVVQLWTPPFASEHLRRRLWAEVRNPDAFSAAVEREGLREAERVAGMGVALARAAGWPAEPRVARCFGDEGLQLARLTRETGSELLLLGSRGLGGAQALLGSASDTAVHHADRPVLVVPYPLLSDDAAALGTGPVLVGWDGSAGSRRALDAARRLWPDRHVLLGVVDQDGSAAPDDAPSAAVLRLDSDAPGSSAAVAAALSAAARAHGAAVVAVGSRGRSALREVVLGSVAMGTLHRAHRPVLVVP
jgi:nucleotide-binding universal stress UspA family protein